MTNRSIEVEATLRLALEALESAEPKYTKQRADQKTLGGSLDYWKLAQHQRLKAITAIKAALEAHKALAVDKECLTTEAQQSVTCVSNEQVEPVAWLRQDELDDLRTCNYRHLGADSPSIWAPNAPDAPSPDMKLVAVYTTPRQPKEPEQRSVSEHLEPVAEVRAASNACGQYSVEVRWFGRLPEIGDKLYTSPPYVATERRRKPLTDKQIKHIYICTTGWSISDGDPMLVDVARAIEAAHGIRSSDFKE